MNKNKYVLRCFKLSVLSMLAAMAGQTAIAAHSKTMTKAEMLAAKGGSIGKKYTPSEIENMRPTTTNPLLSRFVEGTEIDYSYWNMKNKMDASSYMPKVGEPTAFMSMRTQSSAAEERRGANFQVGDITFLPQLGTLRFQEQVVEINGQLELPQPEQIAAAPEDDGSIPLATELNIAAGSAVIIQGEIGDGPFGFAGTGSGDFDYFKLTDLKAGQVISFKVETPEPFGPLDPNITIYNEFGEFLDFNEDLGISSFDSFTIFEVPEDGTYFLEIGSFSYFLEDPFDSSSGTGVIDSNNPDFIDEGVYTATIGVDYVGQEQRFLFFGRPGDVISVDSSGLSKLAIVDPAGNERMSSVTDSFVSNFAGRVADVAHVVDTFGVYEVKLIIGEPGDYFVRFQADVPPLSDGRNSGIQTVFLDFDGQTLDLCESVSFCFEGEQDITTMSPLSDFLANWGLEASDEDAVIDEVVRQVRRQLVRDIRRNGGNPRFGLRLLNSRDHADPWGSKNVSRIIIGGTREQLGFDTVGVAQSIDLGNFNTEETGFVLLDILSDPDPRVNGTLNSYDVVPGKEIEFIGSMVGDIVSHEIGHYMGNFHVEFFNDNLNIMDQFINTDFLVGDDFIFGTADDPVSTFGRDDFSIFEGLFKGIEDTRSTIGWSTSRR